MTLHVTKYWVKLAYALQQLYGKETLYDIGREKINGIQHNSVLRKLQVWWGQLSDTDDSPRSRPCLHQALHATSPAACSPTTSCSWHCGLNHLPCQLCEPSQPEASVTRASSSPLPSAPWTRSSERKADYFKTWTSSASVQPPVCAVNTLAFWETGRVQTTLKASSVILCLLAGCKPILPL